MTSTVSPARPLSYREMAAISSWLILVLIGQPVAWVGFVAAAVLVRSVWWRVLAIASAVVGVAVWPADGDSLFTALHPLDEPAFSRVPLITWTVLCLVAVILNTQILIGYRERVSTAISAGGHAPTGKKAGHQPGPGQAPRPGPVPAPEPDKTTVDSAPAPVWGSPEAAPVPSWGSPTPQAAVAEPQVYDKVEVNTAPVGLLRTLPGVSRSGARKAVEHRRMIGGFRTLEEFAYVVGLGSIDTARLGGRATCSGATSTEK